LDLNNKNDLVKHVDRVERKRGGGERGDEIYRQRITQSHLFFAISINFFLLILNLRDPSQHFKS